MRYANGTLTSSSSSSDLGGRFELDRYENFMTNEESEKAAAREERVPVVRAALEAMRDDGTLHSPGAADKLRARLPWKEKMWNVLVEERAAGHYFFTEEQARAAAEEARTLHRAGSYVAP